MAGASPTGRRMVLWDTESHDEAGYSDPYLALMRYACRQHHRRRARYFLRPGNRNIRRRYAAEFRIPSAPHLDSRLTRSTSGSRSRISWSSIPWPPHGTPSVRMPTGRRSFTRSMRPSARRAPIERRVAKLKPLLPERHRQQRAGQHLWRGQVRDRRMRIPNLSDVVFAFVNLSRSGTRSRMSSTSILRRTARIFSG